MVITFENPMSQMLDVLHGDLFQLLEELFVRFGRVAVEHLSTDPISMANAVKSPHAKSSQNGIDGLMNRFFIKGDIANRLNLVLDAFEG